jgi:hypothetical protein
LRPRCARSSFALRWRASLTQSVRGRALIETRGIFTLHAGLRLGRPFA